MYDMRAISRRGFTYVDLCVCIVLVILLVAYVILGSERTHEFQWRVKCGSNMRQIGQALMLYANENGGHYPRARYDPADAAVRAYTGANAPAPFAPDGPQANDVTAAMYLLLRTQDISPGTFICPITSREPWNENRNDEVLQSHSNFPSEKYLSYSIANPYPSAAVANAGFKWENTLNADFAIGADMNPGTPALLKLFPRSPYEKLRDGNTLNHPSGQNVLYGDGHVDWSQTIFCGVMQDNVYTFDPPMPVTGPLPTAPMSLGITGSPMHKDDSVLLPAATSDPGSLEPTPFRIWLESDAPARLAGRLLVGIGAAWAYVRWGWALTKRTGRAIVRKARESTPAQRRLRRGLCPNCGYDMRASPDRCPECGSPRVAAVR
jgi:prepilin-type processing-associated H-X9-DG protein